MSEMDEQLEWLSRCGFLWGVYLQYNMGWHNQPHKRWRARAFTSKNIRKKCRIIVWGRTKEEAVATLYAQVREAQVAQVREDAQVIVRETRR